MKKLTTTSICVLVLSTLGMLLSWVMQNDTMTFTTCSSFVVGWVMLSVSLIKID